MAGHHYTIRHVAIVLESLITKITDLNAGRKYQILLETYSLYTTCICIFKILSVTLRTDLKRPMFV